MDKIDFLNSSKITTEDFETLQKYRIEDIGAIASILSGNNSIINNTYIILDNLLLNIITPLISDEDTHWEHNNSDAYIVNNEATIEYVDDIIYDYPTNETVIRTEDWVSYINKFVVKVDIFSQDNLKISRIRNFIQIEGSIIYNKSYIVNKLHETTDLYSSGKWIKLSSIEEEENIPLVTSYTSSYGANNIKSYICIIGKNFEGEFILKNHIRTPKDVIKGDIYLYVGFVKEGTENIQLNYNNQISL